MAELREHCVHRHMEARVLNALWSELNPDTWPRPGDWQPRADEVAHLRLEVIPGLGYLGQEIVKNWLEDHGFPRKKPTSGPAREPHWQPKDRRLARIKPRGS